ncbi:MAG: peptidoglycan DD-metalloendopeptidase family protein [Gammaproteobacteria bacterium]|nr:peptidoglycan DD-metalloendopeptidase family protein [Gammaproteobacteria bacterium]
MTDISPVRVRISITLAGLCLLLLAPPLTAKSDLKTHQADLEQLHDQISSLQKQLAKRLKKQDRLQHQLRQNDLKISSLDHQQRTLRHQLEEQTIRLTKLRRQHQQQSDQLAAHVDSLRQQLRLAYENQASNRLTLAMNAGDPAELSRQFVYLDYLNRARADKMEALSQALQTLKKSQAEVEQQQSLIAQKQQEIEVNRGALKQQQAEKSRLLSETGQNIDSESNRLKQLQQNETELQRLIEKLQQLDLKGLVPETGFAEQRGQLAWPVAGKVIVPYGSRRQNSRVRWSGTVLNPEARTDVRSIFAGRVVFADWLRGFGLLLIIDHGQGYLSLYGYNLSLHKGVGEWVESRDVIATAGSDEQGNGHLYFEIRQAGKPQDPGQWCRG